MSDADQSLAINRSKLVVDMEEVLDNFLTFNSRSLEGGGVKLTPPPSIFFLL